MSKHACFALQSKSELTVSTRLIYDITSSPPYKICNMSKRRNGITAHLTEPSGTFGTYRVTGKGY